MHTSLTHLADLDGGSAWLAAGRTADLDLSPLHSAVVDGDVDSVALLLRNRPDVNRPMHYGFTALHLAARGYALSAQSFRGTARLQAWTRIIELLLSAGANPAARDWKNRLPMALAEGHAPWRLRQATEDAASRGEFFSESDVLGQGKRAAGDIMLRTDGTRTRREQVAA